MKLLVIGNESSIMFKSIIDAVRNRELPVQLVGVLGTVEGNEMIALANGDKEAGCTVHIVNEKVDDGPIVAQGVVAVLENDTPKILRNRISGIAGSVCVKAIGIMHSSFLQADLLVSRQYQKAS